MTQRPTVLLLIPHLGGGGAERVFALLAAALPDDRYLVHLATMTGNLPPRDEFPAGVRLHALGALRVRGAALRLLGLIWHLRPAVVLSGMYHLNFLTLLLRPLFPPATRVLVRQNGMVSATLTSTRSLLTRTAYRWLYRHADRVVCQTEAMVEDLMELQCVRRERIIVLNNPVDVKFVAKAVSGLQALGAASLWKGAGPHLLAVGRLSPEKGFDRLLEALYEVRKTFPLANLILAGSGPQESRLRQLAARLGLSSAVMFPGYLSQPATLFPGATLFVVSSWHEGMPNAMLEAAAAGLPIVALPASGGVGKLLRGQAGVWLGDENTTAALAASLQRAVQALEPGQRFTHSFLEPFKMEHSIAAYHDLIAAEISASEQRRAKSNGGRD